MTAAVESGAELAVVYVEPGSGSPACAAAAALAIAHGVPVVELEPRAIAKVADAATPQPILAIAPLFDVDPGDLDGDGVVLVLLEVRDPGNLGTAVRAADAAGAAGVVVAGQAVDPFNPKALRATAGSAFHLPIAVAATLEDALGPLREQGRAVLGAVARGGTSLWTATLPRRAAVVVGGEAAGLGDAVLASLDALVTIEMTGRAESLNVGVAAALLCFEWRRRAAADPALRPTI